MCRRSIAPFGDAYEKIGTIQRRLAWPLHKDDTLFQSGRPTGLNIYFTLRFLQWGLPKMESNYTDFLDLVHTFRTPLPQHELHADYPRRLLSSNHLPPFPFFFFTHLHKH